MQKFRNWAARAAALALTVASVSATPAPAADNAQLLRAASGARYVLLGESTHGTREYYVERARLTHELIAHHDARAVAIEGDWSGAERVNRYVRGLGPDRSAAEALSDFRAFPGWMWRNVEFRDFVEQLRTVNLARPVEQRIGVYGLDVYDLFDAGDAVVAYLDRVDPAAAARARVHLKCFARHGRSTDRYALAVRRGSSCESAAEAVQAELARVRTPAPDQADVRFAVERAAATVVAGEEYFRVLQTTGYAWNARDRRMAAGARQIASHLSRAGQPAKVVIWAHNTHVGDASETSMRERGELSLGQLLRADGAFLVGFMTAGGKVLAAEEWDGPAKVRTLREPLAGSHEAELAGQAGDGRLVRILRGLPRAGRKLQRAVGVVYAPASEKVSHYITAHLERQFDAVVFLPRTSAVTPLPGARG